MTGCQILGQDEEMGNLSKSQPVPSAGRPLVNAVLCLLQQLVYMRLFDLLSVQQNFPVKCLI